MRFNHPIATRILDSKVWQLAVPVSVSVVLGRVTIDPGRRRTWPIRLADDGCCELSGLTTCVFEASRG